MNFFASLLSSSGDKRKETAGLGVNFPKRVGKAGGRAHGRFCLFCAPGTRGGAKLKNGLFLGTNYAEG